MSSQKPIQAPRPSEVLEELSERYPLSGPGIESLRAKYIIPDGEAQGTANAPADGDSGYWANAGLLGRLEQDWSREYGPGPDGQVLLLKVFCIHVCCFLFTDEWARVWVSLPEDVNSDLRESSSWWDIVIRERRWLSNVFPRIERLARKHGHGEQPLNWLDLYISGIQKTLNDSEMREIQYSLVLLYKSELWEQDEEQNDPPLTDAGRNKNKSGAPGRKSTGERDKELAEVLSSLDTKALVVLLDHPEWDNTKIAEHVGCYRTSLYRLEKFKAIRALLKSEGIASMPKGSKIDGQVDAWEGDI